METDIFNLIKDLSYPAVIGLALILLSKAGIWRLVADFLRGKINGSTDLTTKERLDIIEKNHLQEL